jgi:hypothetical protein
MNPLQTSESAVGEVEKSIECGPPIFVAKFVAPIFNNSELAARVFDICISQALERVESRDRR